MVCRGLVEGREGIGCYRCRLPEVYQTIFGHPEGRKPF
jgi:hypothetical protein